MDCAEEGYVTGAKDGLIRLWDSDFKPITKVDLTQSSDGYPGAAPQITRLRFIKLYKIVLMNLETCYVSVLHIF